MTLSLGVETLGVTFPDTFLSMMTLSLAVKTLGVPLVIEYLRICIECFG